MNTTFIPSRTTRPVSGEAGSAGFYLPPAGTVPAPAPAPPAANELSVRLGSWLFAPAAGLVAVPGRVLRDAPVHRGAADAPVAEYVYRTGGEAVYFSEGKGRTLTVPQYRLLLRQRPQAVREDWRIVQRTIASWVRGTVHDPRHGNLTLSGWHRVLPAGSEPAIPEI